MTSVEAAGVEACIELLGKHRSAIELRKWLTIKPSKGPVDEMMVGVDMAISYCTENGFPVPNKQTVRKHLDRCSSQSETVAESVEASADKALEPDS